MSSGDARCLLTENAVGFFDEFNEVLLRNATFFLKVIANEFPVRLAVCVNERTASVGG